MIKLLQNKGAALKELLVFGKFCLLFCFLAVGKGLSAKLYWEIIYNLSTLNH
jgi:hypothetical protein